MNRIRVVALGVSDVDRALQFYQDGLPRHISEESPPQGEGFGWENWKFRDDGSLLIE